MKELQRRKGAKTKNSVTMKRKQVSVSDTQYKTWQPHTDIYPSATLHHTTGTTVQPTSESNSNKNEGHDSIETANTGEDIGERKLEKRDTDTVTNDNCNNGDTKNINDNDAIDRDNNKQQSNNGDEDKFNDSEKDIQSEGEHGTTSEGEYQDDSFCDLSSEDNKGDEEWTDSMKEGESDSEDEEMGEEDYDDDESKLDYINNRVSSDEQEDGACIGEQRNARQRRSTARPETYQYDSESNGNNEGESEDESTDNGNNNDSEDASRFDDDYPESEHEDNTYGSDDNDDDASLHTGDEGNMSDNDDPEETAKPTKQTTIMECKPYIVRKQG